MLVYNQGVDGGTFEESTEPQSIHPDNMIIGERYFIDKCFDLSGVLVSKSPSISFDKLEGDIGAYQYDDNGYLSYPKYITIRFYTYVESYYKFTKNV